MKVEGVFIRPRLRYRIVEESGKEIGYNDAGVQKYSTMVPK